MGRRHSARGSGLSALQSKMTQTLAGVLGCGAREDVPDRTPCASPTGGEESPGGLPSRVQSFDFTGAGATFAVTQTAASLVCGALGAAIGGALAGPGGLVYGAMEGATVGLAASGTVTPVAAAAATIVGAAP
eukprot:TRINITY_DN113256_c0_g1_i1.p1 TRINITY_DN113256_c0_g1~~TRINITY_DN113256_c0_g1_i1.p1  ORF type:complete len:132 (-),score=12.71 TRINITY_DN113256_c0_g1_i1:193-588(-)